MKKTAVITGGSSGLGFALAELLGKEGYSIIIIARNQDKINKAVSSLSDLNITAKGFSCDITDENGLKKVFDQIKNEYEKIDYLILNAGVVSTKLLSDYQNATEMKQDLEIDLWGTILSAHTFLPLLVNGTNNYNLRG